MPNKLTAGRPLTLPLRRRAPDATARVGNQHRRRTGHAAPLSKAYDLSVQVELSRVLSVAHEKVAVASEAFQPASLCPEVQPAGGGTDPVPPEVYVPVGHARGVVDPGAEARARYVPEGVVVNVQSVRAGNQDGIAATILPLPDLFT